MTPTSHRATYRFDRHHDFKLTHYRRIGEFVLNAIFLIAHTTDSSHNDKSAPLFRFAQCPDSTISDIFGQTVVGSFSAWNHVVKQHQEMVDKKDVVKLAIERPRAVHLGNTAADRMFRGEAFASGFWEGSFPVVIVEYNKQNIGFLRTAYLSNLEPRGVIIWPKS